MRRVLLLRPGGEPVPGADLLVTHRIVPAPFGIAATRTLRPRRRDPRRLLARDGRRPGRGGRVRAAPVVPPRPDGRRRDGDGARGGGCRRPASPPSLPGPSASSRSSRAAARAAGSSGRAAPTPTTPRSTSSSAAASTSRHPSSTSRSRSRRSTRSVLRAFRAGEYDALAIGSLAALDVFLDALGADGPADLPPVRFGVVGPETARLLVARGFPAPAVPRRPLLTDLIALLALPKEA